MGLTIISSLHILAQLDLSDAFSAVGGTRFITGATMLVHMFWAELFVGFALAAPVLQAWGARTGSPRMDRLAHSMARFNVLTFSTGATFAVLFVVLLIGLYPRVTTSLFTHFFYFIALAMLSMGLALWGMYYIVDRRLEPRAVHQATLHRVGGYQSGNSVFERTGEA